MFGFKRSDKVQAGTVVYAVDGTARGVVVSTDPSTGEALVDWNGRVFRESADAIVVCG